MRSLGSSPKVVGSVASEWHLGLGWVGVMVAFFRVTYYVNTYAYTHNVRNVRTVELRRTAANGSQAIHDRSELRELTYGCGWCSKWMTLKNKIVVCYGNFWGVTQYVIMHVYTHNVQS